MKTALTIAGSDCSGGAGIQADLKTFIMHGVYGMSAVTALTAQNTRGVTDIQESTPAFLAAQLDAVFTDIFPDAVKVGMVSSVPLIEVIAERLRFYKAKNIVVDPVMVATSGSSLIKGGAVSALTEKLFPLADIVTPNIPEGETLCGFKIENAADMEKAARKIHSEYGCSVLLKGGHGTGGADDLFCTDAGLLWLRAERVDNPNTHGTGCTLSSAIAANLAKGASPERAVRLAKDYVTGALRAGLDLGHGSGPLNHAFAITEHQQEEKL